MPTSTARTTRTSLGVDQQLSEGAALRVGPELADPLDRLEIGEIQDMEELNVERLLLSRAESR